MTANDLGAGVLLLVLVVSALSYRHRGGGYSAGKDQRIDSPVSFAWAYRFIQVTTAFFGFATFYADHPLLLELHDTPALIVSGSLMSLLGLSVFVAAKRTLGRQYSPCFDSFLPHDVVRTGVYGYVRHPIYTGNFLILGGLALATGSLWIALDLALLVAYYTVAAKNEERALGAQFAEYRDYLRQTGRFFPRTRSKPLPL